MIVYFDTSALVKAYINESFSNEILNLMKEAEIVASHVFAFIEAHATFSRIKREKKLTEKEYELVKKSFTKDWENYLHIEDTVMLLQPAVDFAEAFGLRAYDSVHLAAAHILAKKSKQPVTFACFDHQLNKAAHVLGLLLLPN